MRFEDRRKNPRVVLRFDHWGAAKGGLQLGETDRPYTGASINHLPLSSSRLRACPLSESDFSHKSL